MIGEVACKSGTNRYVDDRTTIETRETYRHNADSETQWAAEAMYATVFKSIHRGGWGAWRGARAWLRNGMRQRGGENSLRSVQRGVIRRLQCVSAALRGW